MVVMVGGAWVCVVCEWWCGVCWVMGVDGGVCGGGVR